MMDPKRLFLHDDPLSVAAGFNFERVVDTMQEFVLSVPENAPFSICVSGGWGVGKTTLMRCLRSRLDSNDLEASSPHHVTIWFDPWKLSTAEEVRHALTRRVLDVIERDSGFLRGAGIAIDRKNVLRMLGERLLKIDVDNLSSFYQAEANTQGTFVEVEDIFRRVADVYLSDKEQPRKIVVFVDDLDRCSSARAVEVLETVKLFFDLPGLVFVFGLDRDQLERAVEHQYGYSAADARVYLEKMFQLTVPLPRKGIDDLGDFLAENLREVGVEHLDSSLRLAIVNRFGRNLRNLKLFINSVSFHRRLTEDPRFEFDEELLFKWLYLDSTMPRSMTASLRQGSINLIVALELLAHGGFIHDPDTLSYYSRQLRQSSLNHVALVAFAIVSLNEKAELSPTGLNSPQRAIVDGLRADGEITSTLRVLREGHVRMLDADLQRIVFLTHREEVKGSEVETESDRKRDGGRVDGLDWASPLGAKQWNDLGDDMFNNGHYVDAYFCYLMAVLIQPNSSTYMTDLGRVFRQVGSIRAAEWLYWRAYEIDPSSRYLLVEMAFLYDHSHADTGLGNLFYRKALMAGATSTAAPYNLSINLHDEGNYDDAYLASIDAYLRAPKDAKRQRRLATNAAAAGHSVTPSKDDLHAVLAEARRDGRYPLALTDADEKRLIDLARRRQDPPTDELSRPPV